MTLSLAQRYAGQIAAWLQPHCERVAIAGSVRRGRPVCADVDLVVIPKVQPDMDLFGQTGHDGNLLFDFLQVYVKDRNPLNSPGRKPRFVSGGERVGKQVIIELPKCQLDLWFADERTWATRLMCRTGSREHNIWLAERALGRGLHWNPYEDLGKSEGRSPKAEGSPKGETWTEEAIYQALGLEFIRPEDREGEWLAKHIDSGL